MLNPEPTSDRIVWPGRVANATFLGADMLADVECDNGVILRVRTRASVVVGERGMVGIADEGMWTIPEADTENGTV